MRYKRNVNLLQLVGLLLLIVVIITALLIALATSIQSLTSQITQLQKELFETKTQLSTYRNTLCNSEFSVEIGQVTTSHTVMVDGVERTYRVHTPKGYTSGVRYPAVLSFDGIDGSGAQMQSYSGLDDTPAIIVYPDSLMGSQHFTAWQGAPYSVDGDRDLAFIKEILHTLPSQYCVDTANVFTVGMSNGGSFAMIVGCEFGDEIRSVASIAGAYYTSCTNEQRTPSLLTIHSKHDNRVYFNGDTKRGLPEVKQWMQQQVRMRGCATAIPPVLSGTTTYYNWLDCTNGSSIRFVVLANQMHGWVRIPQVTSKNPKTTAQYIWSFFESTMQK